MEPKKKMGRPSQGKVWLSHTFDKETAEYIISLPDGERSKFVNEAVVKEIARLEALTFADNLRNGLDEQSNVPQVDR